jgi:hypothetical protein
MFEDQECYTALRERGLVPTLEEALREHNRTVYNSTEECTDGRPTTEVTLYCPSICTLLTLYSHSTYTLLTLYSHSYLHSSSSLFICYSYSTHALVVLYSRSAYTQLTSILILLTPLPTLPEGGGCGAGSLPVASLPLRRIW